MSGTEILFSLCGVWYWRTVEPMVLDMLLCKCYETRSIVLCDSYAMSGTDKTCYATSETHSASFSIPACLGTTPPYSPTRFTVLTLRVLLPAQRVFLYGRYGPTRLPCNVRY
eukprot:3719771-Rhodomonas_salina.4